MSDFDFVFLGGSLPGLVASLLVRKHHPNARLLVVDVAEKLGGNLLGHQVLGEHFDAGTHILQQIGDTEIDEIIEDCVDPNHLLKLDSSKGDFAGTMYGNSLWTSTAFPDVIGRSPDLATVILDEIRQTAKHINGVDQLAKLKTIRSESATKVSMDRYGKTASEKVVLPIIRRLFGTEIELSGFALEFCNLMRLQVVDHPTWLNVVQPTGLGDRIAYPNQIDLPKELRHSRKSLYSSKNGASDFAAGLIKKCQVERVHLANLTRVTEVNPEKKQLSLVRGTELTSIKFGHLVSCVGVTQTRKLFDLEKALTGQFLPNRIYHYVLKRPTNSNVCYFYAHDPKSVIFRVTNYRAFSGREWDCRLTVETIGHDVLTDDQLQVMVQKELCDYRIIGENSVDQVICISGRSGYPVPSTALFNGFEEDENFLKTYESKRIYTTGIGASRGLFFQNEIVRHVTGLVRSIL